MLFLKYRESELSYHRFWYGKAKVFQSWGFILMFETEFPDHRKGMEKVKEFPNYGFLNIFQVKDMELLKHRKSELPCHRHVENS